LLDSIAAASGVPGAVPVVVMTGMLQRAVRRDEIAGSMATLTVLPQRGDGLGERIAAAHADAALALPGRRTLQIGMDTPQLDAAMLGEADDALAHPGVDAVLGPAVDGGWWALGLRRPSDAALVVGVPTSREDTGARTLDALRAGGLRVHLLPELSDVDTAADVASVAAAAPRSRFAAAVAALPAGSLDLHVGS
jgi:glycosyltransferase A (GT-A) superfamily protein (DUF2064 family)